MIDGWSRRAFLRRSALAGGLAATPGVLSGCSAFGFGDTLENVRREGAIRVGFAGERPYSYEQDGELVGAIAAVHRAVFERLGGIEVRGVRTEFGELLDGLNAGNFDAVAAGMFITADRCDRASFSDPVYCAKSALLVRRGNPLGLSDYRSVADNAEVSLAVLAGGVEGQYVEAVGVPRERVTQVGTQEAGLELVASGEVDAFTLTSISLRALVERATREDEGPPAGVDDGDAAERVEVLEAFTPVLAGEEQLGCGGAAFRKPDDGLRAAFNETLAALRREGGFLDLVEPYGFTEAEMPEPDVTTEELCRVGGVTGEEIDPLPR